jgi:recombination protein RecA
MPLRFPRYADDQALKGVSTKLIRKVIKKINEQFEREDDSEIGVATTLDDSVFSQPRGFISSGILPLDCIVCFGLGFPTAIIEIYGGEATFKTGILENTLASAQKHGYYTGLIATEYALDYRRAKSVGLRDEELIILDCETMEDVYDQIRSLVREIRAEDEVTPILIGWDSIAATPTRSELAEKADLETSDMGRSALQMSKMFRRLMRFLFKNKVCLICINQTRTNLAQMFGSKESTYGGRALRFYATIRIRVRKVKDIKVGEEVVGMLCEAECIKNKVAPPRKSCRLPVYWSKGIDKALAVWEYAIDQKVLKRKGTAYKYGLRTVTRNTFPKFYRARKHKIDRLLRKATVVTKEAA